MEKKGAHTIDMVRTGKRLKKYIARAGLTVQDVQKYLELSCPQPVYRWYKGQILPTVDHLYRLSELLGVHMEELLVPRRTKPVVTELDLPRGSDPAGRIWAYYCHMASA